MRRETKKSDSSNPSRDVHPSVIQIRGDFTEVLEIRPEGPDRSGIDFGRKVNPTSVATAREAARDISIPRTREYVHIQALGVPPRTASVHGWQRYLPSWRVQAEENLVIKFVPAS